MNIHTRLLFLLATVLIVFIGAQATVPRAFAEITIEEIVVFGDSFSDTGNVLELSKGAFAGEPYFGGRFSNGPVWVEHLAHGLGFDQPTEEMPVPAPSLGGGTNYAYGGAQAGRGVNQTSCAFIDGTRTCVSNIGLQVENYLDDVSGGLQALDDNTLVVVQGGSNNQAAIPAAVQLAQHVATLADAGGKLFLVPNLYRLSNEPWTVHDDQRWDVFVADFNATLEEELEALKANHDDITIMLMNWFELYEDILSRPGFYGLSNVTDPVCPACAAVTDPSSDDTLAGEPDEFLYWDAFHFTAGGNKIFGEAAAEFVKLSLKSRSRVAAVPEPALAGMLSLAATALFSTRRRKRVAKNCG